MFVFVFGFREQSLEKQRLLLNNVFRFWSPDTENSEKALKRNESKNLQETSVEADRAPLAAVVSPTFR